MKDVVFWDVTSCLVIISEECTATTFRKKFLFNIDDEARTFL
jgi:hypothetical protein